jgi:glycosyltransferase involved in cell wall biosynthesis
VFLAFKDFYQTHDDAILYIHADVIGRNNGVNLIELGKACGIDPERMRTSDQLQLHLGIPNDNIASLYNCFDVLAMPSFGEGFGIPLIESQACGIPVITSDWTAMTELCGAGWLVDGEPWYDATQGSFFKVPYISQIRDALEEAYKTAGSLSEKAVSFAAGYDVERVTEDFWVPVMAEITRPREVAPLKAAA